jgi:excisionase family DNA binding protein
MKAQVFDAPQTGAPAPLEELITTKELMRFLKVKHRKTIYDLIDEGLPVIVVGRSYRFVKREVIQFLKANSGKRKGAAA